MSTTSLALKDNSRMKKRSCCVCTAVFPVPQGLALQGMSSMGVAPALLLSLGLFFLHPSCLQRLSLPILGGVWSLACVRVRFKKVCLSLLVKGHLPPPELRSHCTWVSGDVCWFSGGGAPSTRHQWSMAGKGGSAKVQGGRAWC